MDCKFLLCCVRNTLVLVCNEWRYVCVPIWPGLVADASGLEAQARLVWTPKANQTNSL